MKADLSRNTFDRTRHYSSVRLQQGRIVTDADWNEQADITRYHTERQARDTIGACGAPVDAAGYGLVAETNALAVYAANADRAWIAAEDGVLLITSNAGTNWTLVDDLSTTQNLRAFAAAGSTGWAVGDGGTVFKTADTGLSWNAQDAGTFRALRGVAVFDATHAWAVGDNGVVISTTDGATWILTQTDAGRLYAVAFADAMNGVAVGQGGAILVTANGGADWSTVDSGVSAHLRAITRTGATDFWAAGQDGTILQSTDTGVTWAVIPTPSTATLHALAFRADGNAWAAGEDGILLHSNDGGATWLEETTGLDTTLRSLSVNGSESCWVVGDASVVLRVGDSSPAPADVILPAVNLSIQPGCYYVDGMLCELEERYSYAHQVDGGSGERLGAGTYLMYLDAWQHHVTALEAPAIREVALGGPDTATRARTVAQVRALQLQDTSPPDWNCDAEIDEWDTLTGTQRARLSARAEPQLEAANLCEIAATAGYRRLENQLYRVEIHEGGTNPTFKWSRENGSVAYSVVSIAVDTTENQTTVRLAARGRDTNLDLAPHDRVELLDDEAALTGRTGELFEYLNDGNDELELVLAGIPTGALGRDPALHLILRRWDHKPTVDGMHTLPVRKDEWDDLEDGVQIRFESGGDYRPGDYWQIPARTITGYVEWPRNDDGDPVACEPAGITDARCRIGIVEVDTHGTILVTSDCRELFPPLTALEQLLYVSGDGQDAAPNTLLPQPLELRVTRGTSPVAGARIRFEVESGVGLIGPDATSATSTEFDTTTDDDGLATCRWTLGSGALSPDRHQRVRASLLDAEDRIFSSQTLVYCATATMLLQYVSGDGQQAEAGAPVPNPLQVRVINGSDGVTGASLTATVELGGGAVVGAASVSSDPDGYASFGWQLGASDAQRLTVRLNGSDGTELQRLTYTAHIDTRPTTGGGCAVTIGKGGQFPELTSDLLAELLKRGEGFACICFLPGKHALEQLFIEDGQGARLSLHGCGPTSTLNVHGRIELDGFAALEFRDIAISLTKAESEVSLESNKEVRISGVTLARRAPDAPAPGLTVSKSDSLYMTGSTIRAGMPAAVVIETIGSECHIINCRVDGTLSFYGIPDADLSDDLVKRLNGSPPMTLRNGTARLHLTDNSIQLLTIGKDQVKLLQNRKAKDLFQTTVLQGNTFVATNNVFAGWLVSFDANSFVATPQNGNILYGAIIAQQAAAAGNVAATVDDSAFLHFLTPQDGGFRGAANRVFTVPAST